MEQEVIETNELRKQQITELGAIRQDEKIKNEREIERIHSKYEHEINSLKKRSRDDIENCKEEIKVRDERIRRLNEKIKDLEESVNSEKNDNRRLKETFEKEKNECYSLIEAEKCSIKRSYSSQLIVSEQNINDKFRWLLFKNFILKL